MLCLNRVPHGDLENYLKLTKIESVHHLVPMIYQSKFGKNLLAGR